MPTSSLNSRFKALEKATREQWRGWAETIAEGGNPPVNPITVLEAAGILVIAGPPAVALEADAAALREVRVLEARAEERDRAHAELIGRHGDRDAVQAMVQEAVDELRRVKELATRIGGGSGASYFRNEADRIRNRHPRIFSEE